MSGLVLALAYTWLVCLGILLTGYWPEWFRPGFRTVVWLLVASIWLLTVAPQLVRLAGREAAGAQVDWLGLFCHAQAEYLKGNLRQAERLLLRLLSWDPDDCDARMMLATLYRHGGQLTRSRQQLDQLARSPGASKWELEVARELQLLRRRTAEATEATDVTDDDARTDDAAAGTTTVEARAMDVAPTDTINRDRGDREDETEREAA